MTGTVEGRRHHIHDDLFSQRRGVNDHCVLTAGFGNQWNATSTLVQTSGDAALQDRGNSCGTGEHHAADTFVSDQLGTDGFAVPWQQLQGVLGNASFMQDLHAQHGNQGCLLRRLGQYGIAGA